MRLLRFFFSNSFTSLFFLNSSQNCIRSSAILFLRQALLIDCVLSLTQLLLCIQPPKDDIHSLSMIAVVHTILCWFCIDIIDRNTCTKSPQTARNNDTIAFESSSILSGDRLNWTLSVLSRLTYSLTSGVAAVAVVDISNELWGIFCRWLQVLLRVWFGRATMWRLLLKQMHLMRSNYSKLCPAAGQGN